MSELKEINLDPENNKDDREIENLKKELAGLKKSVDFLSKSIGAAEEAMWKKCTDTYPEVKDGVWQLKKNWKEFKLVQINKD